MVFLVLYYYCRPKWAQAHGRSTVMLPAGSILFSYPILFLLLTDVWEQLFYREQDRVSEIDS